MPAVVPSYLSFLLMLLKRSELLEMPPSLDDQVGGSPRNGIGSNSSGRILELCPLKSESTPHSRESVTVSKLSSGEAVGKERGGIFD